MGPLVRRLHRSPLASRLVRGAAWSFVGAAVARAMALVASIVVARMLTKELYGALGAIQNTIGFFGTVAGFGLGTAATKYIAEHRRSDPIKAGRIIAFVTTVACITAGAASLGVWFGADTLARRVLAAPQLAGELRTGSLVLFITTFNGLQMGILAGFEAFRAIAAVNLWSGLASAPIQMLGASVWGLQGAVWSLVVTALVSALLAQWVLKSAMQKDGVRFELAGCSSEARVVAGFGSSLVVAGLVVAGVNWMATTLVVNAKAGYAEMATLNAANNWFGIVVFFAATIQQGIFPALAESVGKGTTADTAKIVRTSLVAALIVATPLALLGVIASPWLMALYGREFAPAWPVLALTVVCAWVYCFHVFLNQFLLALDQPKWFFLTHLAWAVAYMLLLLARLMPGALGFTLARLLSFVLLVGLNAAVLWRLLRARAAETGTY